MAERSLQATADIFLFFVFFADDSEGCRAEREEEEGKPHDGTEFLRQVMEQQGECKEGGEGL